MSLITLEFNHANTIEASAIDALADEGLALIDDLENEIEELKEEKEALEEGEEDNEEDNSERLKEIDQEIEDNEKEIKDLKSDVDHLQGAYNELSRYNDMAISEDHLDDYIRSSIEESNAEELESLSGLIKNNINWSGIIEDAKTDYSEFELDGFTYFFC